MLFYNRMFLDPSFSKKFSSLIMEETWSIKQAYVLNKLSKDLDTYITLFNEAKLQIYNTHGKLDAEKDQWVFLAEDAEKVNRDIEELANIDFTITYEKLLIPEDYKTSVSNIEFLENFFTFPLDD